MREPVYPIFLCRRVPLRPEVLDQSQTIQEIDDRENNEVQINKGGSLLIHRDLMLL
jgi:hypothetical protein